MDNIQKIKTLIDLTTPEWQWIMSRQYRNMPCLNTIVKEHDDRAEDLLPDAVALYRCLEQGLHPHKSLLPQ